jgi:hypothetical protein
MNVMFSANCNVASLPWIHGQHWNINFKKADDVLKLNRWDIPFVNNVTYLCVTFDRRKTWRRHAKRTVANALHMYVKTYSLFRSVCLSTNIKLTIYKALIRSVITYASHTWEHVADACLLKLQLLHNRVLCDTENFTGALQSTNCMWVSKFFTCMTN